MFFFSRKKRASAHAESALLTHAAQGDAIPYIATVIGFLEEAVRTSSNSPDAAHAANYAARVREELCSLQRAYQLVPDTSKDSYETRKMIRFR